MLERIFPKTFDNTYRGLPVGLWIFGVVVFFKALQCITSVLFTRLVITRADGIPLDRFNMQGQGVVLGMFALLGFYLLAVPMISVVALFRYRAMVPFMYVTLLFVQIGGRLTTWAKPIVRSTAMPTGVLDQPCADRADCRRFRALAHASECEPLTSNWIAISQ